MNKGYTYINSKVIISDENGDYTQSEYYDNLDKVLVKENVIEAMEGRTQELLKENEECLEIKKRYMKFIRYWLRFSLISTFVFFGCLSALFGIDIELVALSCSIPLILCGGILYQAYREYQKNANKKNGINSELEFLKSQIGKEKEALKELKKDKTRKNEIAEYSNVKVDDKKQLKALRNYLDLYYNLGYDIKKYFRYYKQGKLDKELQEYYDEEALELAKKYLEEKGPVLTRRKNAK